MTTENQAPETPIRSDTLTGFSFYFRKLPHQAGYELQIGAWDQALRRQFYADFSWTETQLGHYPLGRGLHCHPEQLRVPFFGGDAMQSVLNGLWNDGYRPPDYEETGREVAALKAHIASLEKVLDSVLPKALREDAIPIDATDKAAHSPRVSAAMEALKR